MRHLLALGTLLWLAPPAAQAQRVKLLVPMDSLVRHAEHDSIDAPAHYEVALAYWYAKDLDRAEQHLRQAVAIEPKTAAAYLALAYLPFARRPKLWDEVDNGKVPAEWQAAVEEADRFRRKAFLIDPLVDLKPLALMVPTARSLGLGRRDEAVYTYIINGFGSFWDGQYANAYGFFREIGGNATEAERAKFPNWFLWYEGLAAAHSRDFDRAITNFRTLLARADQQTELDGGATLAFTTANQYRYTLACILDEAGRTAEAVPLLQEVLTSDVGMYMAHVRLAAIYEDGHRRQAALEERERAVAANPDDPSLLFDLGESYAQASRPYDAQAVLRRVRAANPRNVRALFVLGFVDNQLGDRVEAREVYREFLALAPSRFADQKVEAQKALDALP